MESVSRTFQKIGNGGPNGLHTRERCEDFQMPLHYLVAELGFKVEGGKYNFLEGGKYNFSWVVF